MRDFETYAARERLESYRANAARKLTRQQRAQRRRFYRRTSAVFLILLLCLCSALWGMAAAKAIDGPQETRETVPMETPTEAESIVPAPSIEPQEDFENEKISRALYDSGYFRYDVPLDDETQAFLRAACDESGVPYELALAVIRKESTFQNIIGDNGDSVGYMQIQPRWHKERMERLGVTDLRDPFSNFRVGCDYLAELLERYPLEDAMTAYNSGNPGKSDYAKDVISYMEDFAYACKD